MLPDDGLVLHARHVLGGDDVLVAGRRDDDVGLRQDVLERGDLEALHGRLQRADRVDLGDHDAGALAGERLGAALADVAVAADDRHLAADEDVGGPVDPVDQRVAAAVLVVELRLGHRVVDVDGREEELALPRHVDQAVHTGRGLLGDALDAVGDGRPAALVLGQAPGQRGQDDLELLRVGGGRVGHGAGLLELDTLVHEEGGVAAVVEDHVGAALAGPQQGLLGAPPVLLRATRPSRRRPGRPGGRRPCRSARRPRRRRRGPGWRRCCSWHQRTRAPSAVSVSISTAVWIVMCSEPVTRAPASGWEAPNSARMAISPGISCSASSISLRPNAARERSATL